MGAFVTWRWLSVACLALSLLWSLAVLVNPESPAYLMSHKNYDGARASLQKLRGHAYIETELSQTQASLEEAASQRFQISVLWESVNLRPLVVALMLMVGQQLSGVNAVIFFSVNIFNSAKTNLNSLLENIIVGNAPSLLVLGVPTSFRQEFRKKSLNVTNSEKTRESLFTLQLSSADLTSI